MDVPRLRTGRNPASTKPASSSESINSTYAGYDSNEGDNIKVYVRIRPPLKQIHNDNNVDNSLCLEVSSPSSLIISTKPEPKQFSYDHVAGMDTTQEEVFATVGKGIIEAFANGFNGTIFAYGQTGSGKTFTMLGPADDSDNFSHAMRGVIPRGFEYLFSLINRQQEKAGDRVEFLARCSFLEIYNEQVYDLLDPSSAGLHLRENIKKGVFVDGLAERDISTAKDAYSVLQSGWLNRRVASTSMNRESSRSHAVFTVTLESKKRTGGMNNIKISKLHLVDLAGSERQKDTHTQDVRLKEAGSINKSLSALGNVIMSLVDIAHGKTRHVHYRDSKLTFILRDSLGGNAKTYIIANVHPSSRCFGETLSTLNFARRAKMIKNKAVINEDVTGNVSELQAEIRKLKELLSQARAGNFLDSSKTSDISVSNKPTRSPVSSNIPGNEEEWKEMMLNAISERDQSEKEKTALQEKVVRLEEICSKKDKFLQSTRMILKFRTSHIAKLERQIKKEKNGEQTEEDSKDKEIKLLREEIKLLQNSIDHHPEVKKFAMENIELRAEIKRLKALDPSSGGFTKSMAEKHRYTLQLERQLKELMSNQSDDLEKSLSSSQQSLEASNAEIEKIKIELAQVQAKFDTTQNELKQTRQNLQQSSEEIITLRETFRKKELELQSDLAAVRKSNNELERALETFQLKTAVERSTMNSLHIQTIKTLSSPMRLGSTRSTPQKNNQQNPSKFSTPVKKLNLINKEKVNGSSEKKDVEKQNGVIEDEQKKRKIEDSPEDEKYVNDPDRFIEDEPPPKLLQRKDSLNDISDDENDVYPFDWSNETRDDEIVYIEALQEELKQLQDLYSQSIQALYTEQKKKIPLTETIAKLEHKSKELEKLLSTERDVWSDKESDLTKQLTTIRDKYKETQGDATILKSEVDDLRILISSADKQLESLKKEKREDSIESGRKYAALESKYVKLEIDFFNLQSENDATAEANNNLQADFEQCKDELEFSRHKNSELEEIINIERKKLKEKDEELESTMERLSFELDNKIKLTQEDKEQELMHSMETINELREEITQLTRQITEQTSGMERLTADLEKSRSEVAVQKWMNLADKEAINNFLKKVEQLNSEICEKNILISSLQSELEDLKQQYQNLQNSYIEKKEKIHKLNNALKCESDKLAKEKLDREKEVTSLQEEIQLSQDQCKELSQSLEETQSQLQVLQADVLETKVSLAEKINKISFLEEELSNKSSNLDSSIVIVNPTDAEITKDHLNTLAKSWETTLQENEKELETLRNKCEELKEVEQTKDILEDRIKNLELEVEYLQQQRTEWQLKETSFEQKLREMDDVKEKCMKEVEESHSMTEKVIKEKLAVQQQLAEIEMNLCNVQDDLEANLEELEKTKVLEEKYFEEKMNYQSKLAVADEEKKRFQQQIDDLMKAKEKVELEHAKLTGHQNHAQRIQHHMAIKKENHNLHEEIRKLRTQINEMRS